MFDINEELEEMASMNKWFTGNLVKLPLAMQVKYLNPLMNFHEATKPLYIQGLMILGDGSEGE